MRRSEQDRGLAGRRSNGFFSTCFGERFAIRGHIRRSRIRQIADSIDKFGFINPIIIDEHGRVIAGNGRFEAAKLLRLKEVPVIRLSHLSEAAIRAYMLADNRLAEKAGWDRELLAIELSELELLLPQINPNFSITGFEPSEINSIMLDFGDGRPIQPMRYLNRRISQSFPNRATFLSSVVINSLSVMRANQNASPA